MVVKTGLQVTPRVYISPVELYERLREIAHEETRRTGRNVTISMIACEILQGIRHPIRLPD